MGTSVNRIPSINNLFTDKTGRINPIWYEYLRSFISTATETSDPGGGSTGTNVKAGNGLVFANDEITLNVGQGSGIAVNANDVAVDIASESPIRADLSDEVLVSDVSNNNSIRKTQVRDLVALAGAEPAGADTQVQFNDNGFFGADANFTTDGNGNVEIQGSLLVDDITLDKSGGFTKLTFGSDNVNKISFDGQTAASDPRIQSNGGGGYTMFAGDNSDASLRFTQGVTGPFITFQFDSGNTIRMSDGSEEGVQFTGHLPLRRTSDINNTASVTQTQGQAALEGDYNDVSVVANANDVVTLPTALLGRYCTVINRGANDLQVFPASGDDLGEGVDTSTTIPPGNHYTWFTRDGDSTSGTNWYQVDGIQKNTAESGITASTTQTQGQQPLTRDVNEISTVANANDTVTLPSAPAFSRDVTVINNGANTLQIFPASGDDLGAGVDTATTLAAGSAIRYTNYDATNWVAI